MWVQPVVEDLLQEAVLLKLINIYRSDLYLYEAIGKRGNGYIKQKVQSFNEASRVLPHIILTDLDNEECAPAIVEDWFKYKLSKKMLFRIAEREVDAWIMADRVGFASFIGVPVNKIPLNTQTITDPKIKLINIARGSRKKYIKDIVPTGTSNVGPGYNPILQEFIANYWDPSAAAENNKSLSKAIERLKLFLK